MRAPARPSPGDPRRSPRETSGSGESPRAAPSAPAAAPRASPPAPPPALNAASPGAPPRRTVSWSRLQEGAAQHVERRAAGAFAHDVARDGKAQLANRLDAGARQTQDGRPRRPV